MAFDPISYSTTTPIKVEKYAPTEMLVSGNPKQEVLNYYDSGDNKFKTGIWSGEIGSYRLEFGETKHEFFLLIEGVVRVTEDGGKSYELRAGDACVIPPNFIGIFEIIENAKKYYVISE